MNKLKKLIAREGLILISFFTALIVLLLADAAALALMVFLGYFLYLIVRFIIWALMTLEIIKRQAPPSNTNP